MRRLIPIVLALMLAACQRETEPDPLRLTGHIFVFNYHVATATYLITLKREQPLPEGARVRAEFENPAGGAPLTLERTIFPQQDRVVLESPDLACVRKDRPYRVSIAVLGPEGDRLQALETTVTSSLDQSVLPAKPLVTGPGYEKNAEAFKDGKAVQFDMAKCAA